MVSKELVAASSTPLVLSILSIGESYGYAIIKAVRELSEEELNWTDGMLYPVLHRLEQQTFVESYWGVSDSGRKRKYYRITAAGREELSNQIAQWSSVQATMQKIWDQLHKRAR
ncbi:MAG: PadR family transcriptional regulator [Spirochaetales bacterium]|nr:PadR family transcriptional regulator [Spirochaetales bacterium]